MAGGGVPGLPLALIAAGGVLIYSGVQNVTIGAELRQLSRGIKPTPGPGATQTTESGSGPSGGGGGAPGDTGAHSQTAAQNQAIARLLGAPLGWSTGQQWADWVSLWNQESGWSNTALNSSSGAAGIAQALGHGIPGAGGSLGNQYPSQAANNGSASAQIRWGIGYIRSTYGSPSAAWAHEQQFNWY